MKKTLVAAIQYEPAIYAQETNKEELYILARQAAKEGAKIIVLPEMATNGYGWLSRREIRSYVEPIPGPTTELFAEITREYSCYIVVGLSEIDPQNGTFYNTAALVGPAGLVGKYRKTHLFLSDPRWAAEGDLGLSVWDTEYGQLGIAICMDMEFPEVARILALKGAQLIAFPCNWMGENCPSSLWAARAFENSIHIIAANRWGIERGVRYSGGTCIINSRGEVLAYRGFGNGIVKTELELQTTDSSVNALEIQIQRPAEEVILDEDFIKQRRPELYGQLLCNSYLWRAQTFFERDCYHPLPAGCESEIGVLQLEVNLDNKKHYLSRIREWIDRIKFNYPELQLLVLPEFTNVSTGMNLENINGLAEPVPGETTTFLGKLARDYSIYLAWGMLELGNDGKSYVTEVLTDSEGRIKTIYRRTHLLSQEKNIISAGTALGSPVDTTMGRIGLLSGTDLLFNEPARCLALQGVDLIIAPSSLLWSGPVILDPCRNVETCSTRIDDPYYWCLWRIRAWENNIFLAVANKTGRDKKRQGLNLSGIFGPVPYKRYTPDQEVIQESMEGLLIKRISTSRSTREGRIVRDKDNLSRRRTSLYRELLI